MVCFAVRYYKMKDYKAAWKVLQEMSEEAIKDKRYLIVCYISLRFDFVVRKLDELCH